MTDDEEQDDRDVTQYGKEVAATPGCDPALLASHDGWATGKEDAIRLFEQGTPHLE